jgi:hypothetical protein
MSYDDTRFSWWDDSDDEDIDPLEIEWPVLPRGGYYAPCCPEWNSSHVEPVVKGKDVIRWECSHCGATHFSNDLDQWNDEENPK